MANGKNSEPDAGLKSLDHYRNKLPPWRYWPRQKLLPLIRYETPYLAWFQGKIRTPALDSYFAFTANLGTHTFFMVFLPFLFWCGHASLGRGMVHLLASGVFFSGFIKDLLCLPRPLSPPLQRITMSGSAALEYGFPSTHSTNAVSVAVYALSLLNSSESTLSPQANIFLQSITYIYVISIVLGRLYCGMHGFFDVTIGSLLGALLAYLQHLFGPLIDEYVLAATGKGVTLVILVILALVRIHPEPVDDCPCFDDSVAFAGVMVGAQVAYWHLAKSTIEDAATFEFTGVGPVRTALRLVIGVLLLFTWRAIMKPFLLRVLPPIFRGLEKLGLILPRRFFTNASQYTTVPSQLKDHEVLPGFSEIPSIITTIRHPRRRAISVGPQSEADAYETLAYREKRRRESLSTGNGASPVRVTDVGGGHSASISEREHPKLSRKQSKLHEYENMMGTGASSMATSVDVGSQEATVPFPAFDPGIGDDEQDVFSQIKQPRVRYDVEVVTKLVVYSGIAWIVMEGAPLLFDQIGLAAK
ncbi:sphingoid base-phosphate phosphatase [Aspergillus heteromorphus CBS 117.55]|uniref:Sphingoid base-phosphate phosphatase n=1 Tax=Aspergillus heteromorphus CBS 117.55 TaxID=1448321 RepID=A0A317WRL3_9EURO|nr:sphingoid base-phosphate phosphatase [Aspergillus heteromorphus CBS 117.55]PWY86810.1 sphingoid base-phosphate phosphatase [Aspergillus heteromorphus CBS 117.55]